MGTANFSKKNASLIYAVYMPRIDEETGEEYQLDEFDVEEEREFIQESLEKISGYSSYFSRWYDCDKLGSVIRDCSLAGIGAAVELEVVVRSGYYEGANLDYDINIIACNESSIEPDDLDECVQVEDVMDYTGFTRGLATIQHRNLMKRINKTLDELRGEVEDVFKAISKPMRIVGRFNNGECVYENA